MRALPASAAAAAVVALTMCPAHAASPPRLQVQAGYAGVPVSAGLWVPVRVRVDGDDGGAQGTLRVTPPTASGRTPVVEELPIDVPAGESRAFTVAVQAAAGTVTAELRDSGGARIATATSTLASGGGGHVVVAVVSATPGALDAAAGTYVLGRRTQVVDVVRLSVATLPDAPQLLRTFAEVVLAGVDTGGLGSAQRNALSAYVAGGGGLLLTGGGAAQQVLDGVPPDLAPATVTSAGSEQLPGAVAALCTTTTASPPAPPAPVAQSTLSLAHGATAMLRDTSGTPLVAVLGVGLGRSVMAAFDPAAPPLASWSGQGCLVRALVSAALPGRRAEVAMEPTSARGDRGGTVGQVGDASTIPAGLVSAATGMLSAPPPRVVLLAVALGGYALIAGPLAALLPRSPRRRTMLWAALPGLACGVGLAAWTTGLGVARVDPARSQVRVIDVASISTSSVESVAAVSLPRGGGDTLRVPSGSVAAALGSGAGQATHESAQLDVEGAPAGAVSTAVIDWSAGAPGRGVAQSLRWADDTHLTGTLTNHLGTTLLDATLLGSDGSTTDLGTIADGASVRADVVAETAVGGYQAGGGGCTTLACLASGPRASLLRALDAWTEERHPGVPALFAVAARPLLPGDGMPALDAVVVPLTVPDGEGAPLPARGLAAQGFESNGAVTDGSVTLRNGDWAMLDVPVPAGAAAVEITPLSESCWTLGCVNYRLAPNTNPLPPQLFYDWLDPSAGAWRPLPMTLDASGHRVGRLPASRLAGTDLVLRLRSQNLATTLAAPDIREAQQ